MHSVWHPKILALACALLGAGSPPPLTQGLRCHPELMLPAVLSEHGLTAQLSYTLPAVVRDMESAGAVLFMKSMPASTVT